jgi:DNA-binding XRE family transcriptional regulator
MPPRKKSQPVSSKLRSAFDSFDAWKKGTVRLRATFTGPNGARLVQHLTGPEFDAKMKRMDTFRGIRDQLKLSQPGFANLLHSTPAAVRQWEQGRRSIPDHILLLAKLAQDPKVRKLMESFSVAKPEPEYVAESEKSKKRVRKL